MSTSGPGEAWRKRREAMGKSVEGASEDLRISPKFIRGIEEGEFSEFPVRVFSSGFIRAYARYLGEDPEPVLTQYYRQLEARTDAAPKPAVRPEWIEREKQRGSRRTAYVIAAAAVLTVGAVLSWFSMRTVAPPPPPVERVPAPPPAPAEPQENAAPAPPGGEGAAPAEARNASAPNAAAGPWHLLLEATEQTWLLYRRDEATPVDVILSPGDRIGIRAEKSLYIRLGNAGGVTATLNGKALPSFGPRGKIREFRLGD